MKINNGSNKSINNGKVFSIMREKKIFHFHFSNFLVADAFFFFSWVLYKVYFSLYDLYRRKKPKGENLYSWLKSLQKSYGIIWRLVWYASISSSDVKLLLFICLRASILIQICLEIFQDINGWVFEYSFDNHYV